MSDAIRRRIAIALVASLLGVILYLYLSRGPRMVQFATVSVHLPFLLGVAWVAWRPTLSVGRRALGIFLLVALSSTASVFVDSLVIKALSPLHPIYFVLGLLGFSIEACLFLGCIWLIDRGIVVLTPPNRHAE